MSARSRCRTRASTCWRSSRKSAEIIPTRLTFVDIAGLVKGASQGEGLGNQFLGNIREVDAIAHVVRCFEDDDVTHVANKIDPVADIETIETELMLADLDSLERRVDALEKKIRGNDKEAKETLDLVQRALKLLREGKPARFVERKAEEEKLFHSLGLLTSLPVLYVCNVDEGAAATGNDYSRAVEKRAAEEGAASVVISAKIESEIAVLPRDEREMFLSEIGLKEPGLDRLIRVGYGLSAPRDVLHRRAEGDARLDRNGGLARAAGRGRDPYGLRARLHPRRDDRLRRLRQGRRRGGRARHRQTAA